MNDCQLQFSSAFFADTEDAPLPEALAGPTGALTRAAAAAEEGWPDAADLAFGEEDNVATDEDEEDTSPGDIEEDPDDLPVADLADLRARAQEIQE